MLQQSVMVVKRSGLCKFIAKLMAAPEADGELPPEVKMERDMAPHGILLAPYGRSRPIEFSRSHFYAQHLTRDELNAFLESENLQFDDWFSPRGDNAGGTSSKYRAADYHRLSFTTTKIAMSSATVADYCSQKQKP